jgi:hypothetical protein
MLNYYHENLCVKRAAVYIYVITLRFKKKLSFSCISRYIWNFSRDFKISKFLFIYSTTSRETPQNVLQNYKVLRNPIWETLL